MVEASWSRSDSQRPEPTSAVSRAPAFDGASVPVTGATSPIGDNNRLQLRVRRFPMPTLLQHPTLTAALMLTASNLFMTFAWYGHLKNLNDRAWWFAALVSWGIALFEYLLQVPANRIGFTVMSLGQLKIMQEVITLVVFVPFAVLLHGPAAQTRLPLGRFVHGRRGVLHFPHLKRDARPWHHRISYGSTSAFRRRTCCRTCFARSTR